MHEFCSQILTKFKVIFDLFTVCVYMYFIQRHNCKLYYQYLMIFFLKFRVKLDIVIVTLHNSKLPQILATTPYCFFYCP